MESHYDRVPVTLLTGFLGAGKTTLLNHLICDPEAGRTAVVMNEFGGVGLDTLIACDTEKGGLKASLKTLPVRSHEARADCMVVQTTEMPF